MKLRLAGGLFVIGTFLLSSASAPAARLDSDSPTTSPPPADAQTKTPAAPQIKELKGYSAGVGEVLKLTQAGVGTEVIKAYIQSSPTAYQPSASEIIVMKESGVSPEVLTAMLHRGGEVRSQAPQTQPNASLATPPTAPLLQAPPPAYAPAPVYDYAPQPAPQITYVAPEPVVYPSYDYSYWGYNYAAPFVYLPSLSFCGPTFGFHSGPFFGGHGNFGSHNPGGFHPGGFGGRPGGFGGRPGSFGGRSGGFGGRSGGFVGHSGGSGGRSMGGRR